LSFASQKFAEAETVISVEGNMCDAAMRGVDAPPESETTSRQKGACRTLGDMLAAETETVAKVEFRP